MLPSIAPPMTTPFVTRVLTAVQCATTLVALLGGLGLIAWLAGLVALEDLPYALAGVFGGSFAMALTRPESRRSRTRTTYRA